MNGEVVTGGCLCGAVRYEADKSSYRTGCCHCRMCQKATGAPFVSLVQIPREAFRYTTGEPKYFNASEISDSVFCGDCGTTLMIRYYPEINDAYVVLTATLDDPNEYPPERHLGVESQMEWLKLDDDLPRTADSSPPTPPLCILPSSGVMIQWQPFKFPYRQSKNAGCLDELKLVSPSPVKSFIIITPAKHSISNPFSSRIFLSLSTEASIPA